MPKMSPHSTVARQSRQKSDASIHGRRPIASSMSCGAGDRWSPCMDAWVTACGPDIRR